MCNVKECNKIENFFFVKILIFFNFFKKYFNFLKSMIKIFKTVVMFKTKEIKTINIFLSVF